MVFAALFGVLVVGLLYGFRVLSAGSYQAVEEAVDREMAALAPLQAELGGCTILRSIDRVREERGPDGNPVEVVEVNVTVMGVLPRWAHLAIDVGELLGNRAGVSARYAVLVDALFGGADLPALRGAPMATSIVAGGGDLTLRYELALGESREHLLEHLTDAAAALCRAFRAGGESGALTRIGEIATIDGRGRAAALRALLRIARDHPVTLAALERARAGDVDEARAIAARADGDIAALVEIAAERRATNGARREVVEALIERGLALELIPLVELLPEGTYTAVAAAFGQLARGPEVSSALVRMLEARDPDAIRAVASALARVGDTGAVAPLRARMKGGPLDDDLFGAIALIQDRGGEGGTLSLADDEQGRLSLADRGGELAVADKE